MRELTQSMIRFSWAMPLLGVDMMSNLLAFGDGRNPLEATAHTLDAMSTAAQQQLGPELLRAYDAGVRVQDDVVDAMFRLIPSIEGGRS